MALSLFVDRVTEIFEFFGSVGRCHGVSNLLAHRFDERARDVVVVGIHWAASSRELNVDSAREACFLTEPRLIDSAAAISTSERSR